MGACVRVLRACVRACACVLRACVRACVPVCVCCVRVFECCIRVGTCVCVCRHSEEVLRLAPVQSKVQTCLKRWDATLPLDLAFTFPLL